MLQILLLLWMRQIGFFRIHYEALHVIFLYITNITLMDSEENLHSGEKAFRRQISPLSLSCATLWWKTASVSVSHRLSDHLKCFEHFDVAVWKVSGKVWLSNWPLWFRHCFPACHRCSTADQTIMWWNTSGIAFTSGCGGFLVWSKRGVPRDCDVHYVLVPFGSTNLCEAGFSAFVCLKLKYLSQLNVTAEMRCTLCPTLLKFDRLQHNIQYPKRPR